jgi:hypothetical protein
VESDLLAVVRQLDALHNSPRLWIGSLDTQKKIKNSQNSLSSRGFPRNVFKNHVSGMRGGDRQNGNQIAR